MKNTKMRKILTNALAEYSRKYGKKFDSFLASQLLNETKVISNLSDDFFKGEWGPFLGEEKVRKIFKSK